ncbi:MAG: hypothetical protein WA089_02415, partial [Anaerolineae bacterium]
MLNTTFVKDMPPRGHIAFLSQSGALCGGIIDWAISRGIGFCRLLSAIDPGRGPRRAAGGAGRPGAPGSTPVGATMHPFYLTPAALSDFSLLIFIGFVI